MDTPKALKIFYSKVDMRSRKDMTQFLYEHYRYSTMNGWNNATSYANKVKIHSVIPHSLTDKVYEMMEAEGFYDDINFILDDWATENDYSYQAGFNGRSSGYIVMYEGYKKKSEHKSVCTNCRQRNFKEATPTDKKCGVCHQDTRVNHTFYDIGTYPGKSIDQGEDFSDWSMNSLRERVKLVQSFDKMCDDVVAQTIYMAVHSTVREETVMIPKTYKVIDHE